MNRRGVLSGIGAILMAVLTPPILIAVREDKLEQFERFRMTITKIVKGPAAMTTLTPTWVPVAFDDIIKGDLIRKALAPEEGTWHVDYLDPKGKMLGVTNSRFVADPDWATHMHTIPYSI